MNSSLPKIGIRPTIDGRMGGVRESLEDQTMGLAQVGSEVHFRAKVLSARWFARRVRYRMIPASGAWLRQPRAEEKFAREGS